MNSLALSKRLLWKDYRQLRPALVGCWAIMATILLLTCVRQLMANNLAIFPDAILLVLAAPTLAAMAASGILIGHERQTRTWNWSSSLPIPWASSLFSKSIVWLVSSILMVGTLYLLFLLLMQLCRWQGFAQDSTPDWISPQMVVMTVLVVPLVVYVCFSLAALLWNDTLTAFVLAAIVVSLLFVALSDWLPRWVFAVGFTRSLGVPEETLGIVLAFLVLVVIAGAFMMRAYRWRWTTGQLASIGWAGRLAAPVTNVQRRVIWKSVAWTGGGNLGEFSMLLAHALCISFAARALIFIGTVVLALMVSTSSDPGGAVMASLLGTGLMGVTVFAGDQNQSAYKFFADRGVQWYKLLIAHALPPLVLALVPVVVTVAIASQFRNNELETLGIIGIGIACFAIGLFCSLCSRLALLSICMTVGAVMLAVVGAATLDSYWNNILGENVPQSAFVFIVVVELSVLLASIVLLTRRWLVYDRVQGAAYYVATLLLAIVPANLLAIVFAFLTIPNVPWQGLDEKEIRVLPAGPVVELKAQLPVFMLNQLYSTAPEHVKQAIQMGYSTVTSQLSQDRTGEGMSGLGLGEGTEPEVTSRDLTSETKSQLNAALKELEADAERLKDGLKGVALNNEIETTAWLGAYAAQELRDLEIARRAWKVNRQLLASIDYGTINSTNVIHSRLTSVLLRNQLTADDWKFLETGGSLAELQPEPVSRETWERLVRMSATAIRQSHRSSPVGLILPLRWYDERRIAFVLHQQLQLLSGKQVNVHPNVRVLSLENQPLPQLLKAESLLPQ